MAKNHFSADPIYESLAVAIAQGLAVKTIFPENFDRLRNWYGDPEIDAYAKALFPLIEEYFESGKSIEDGFVARALQTYRKAFASRPVAPVNLLRCSFLLCSQDDDRILSFKKKLQPTSLWARSLEDKPEAMKFLLKYQGLSGVVIATEYDADVLLNYTDKLPQPPESLFKTLKEGRVLILAQKRRINGYLFWIFSPQERLEAALNVFLSLREIPEGQIIF